MSGSTTQPPSQTPAAGPCGRTSSPPSGYDHVVWIVMENHSYDEIIGSPDAPFINELVGQCGSATDFHGEAHPSLPNYIAMTSGSTQGITDDLPPTDHPLDVPGIFSLLPGGASRSLEESMPSNCVRTNSGDYAVRHNPQTYYVNLGGDCDHYNIPLGTHRTCRRASPSSPQT